MRLTVPVMQFWRTERNPYVWRNLRLRPKNFLMVTTNSLFFGPHTHVGGDRCWRIARWPLRIRSTHAHRYAPGHDLSSGCAPRATSRAHHDKEGQRSEEHTSELQSRFGI